MKRFILAITGASGACYAKKLFDLLKDRSELHVVISERGVELLKLELDLNISYFSGKNVTYYKFLNGEILIYFFKDEKLIKFNEDCTDKIREKI